MSQTATLSVIHRLVWTGLLAALTAAGAAIAIPPGPFSPVPITLQTMFVMLAGLILGPRGGSLVMILYITAGCLGLPIFAGGKAGVGVLLGPTGGFLIGFVPAAFVCGLGGLGGPAGLGALRGKKGVQSVSLPFLFTMLGTAVTLALGTVQLMLLLDISLGKALAVGTIPFLPGALIKCVAATAIYKFLAVRRLLPL